MLVELEITKFDPMFKIGQAVPMLSPGTTLTALNFLKLRTWTGYGSVNCYLSYDTYKS